MSEFKIYNYVLQRGFYPAPKSTAYTINGLMIVGWGATLVRG